LSESFQGHSNTSGCSKKTAKLLINLQAVAVLRFTSCHCQDPGKEGKGVKWRGKPYLLSHFDEFTGDSNIIRQPQASVVDSVRGRLTQFSEPCKKDTQIAGYLHLFRLYIMLTEAKSKKGVERPFLGRTPHSL